MLYEIESVGRNVSMTEDETGSVQAVLLRLDIEGANATAKVQQYIQEAKDFLQDQKQKAGADIETNPTRREISLIESYSEGRYVMSNTQSHSYTLYNTARADIRSHIAASLSAKTEDGTATGTQQFKFTTGNVRSRR